MSKKPPNMPDNDELMIDEASRTLVNEFGMYRLLLQNQKPEAKRSAPCSRRWASCCPAMVRPHDQYSRHSREMRLVRAALTLWF